MATRDLSTPKSKTALVAGAAGFLGSHLTDRLLDLGFDVIGVDNLQTGHLRNLIHLQGSNRFRLIQADIVSPLDFSADYIFNLACPASPPHYQTDPVRTLKTSVIGTLNLLELSQRCGATFVQASTSEVYGDPMQHPQSENYWGNVNPTGIRACYDEGKRAAETLCSDFTRTLGTKTRIARIFNTYGPRMHPDDGRVVSNFIMQALKGKTITVYGDGRQTRSFCYVDDLIEALMAIAFRDVPYAHPINIGNPCEFSILQLAEIVQIQLGTSCEIVHQPLPQDDPKQRQPDLSRAAEFLGWSPVVPLEEGIKNTINYFKSII